MSDKEEKEEKGFIRIETWSNGRERKWQEFKLGNYTIQYIACEKPELGFVARCKERGGAITQGETIEEIKKEMTEVLETLEDLDKIDAIEEPKEVRELIDMAHNMIKKHNQMIVEDPKGYKETLKRNPVLVDLSYALKKAYSIGLEEKRKKKEKNKK